MRHLPDELLLRVMASMMACEHGLSDLYNLSLTSSRMRRLVREAMAFTRTSSVDMQGCAPMQLISSSPLDLRHGVRMLLQSGKVHSLRLNHMPAHQLEHLLQLVDRSGGICELWFVDVAAHGVRVSQRVASRIEKLAISMPKAATLLHLAAMGCKPKTLRLYNIDERALAALTEAWWRLTQRVHSAELLFVDMLHAVPHELMAHDPCMQWRKTRARWLYGEEMWSLRRDGTLSGDTDVNVIRLRDWLGTGVEKFEWPEAHFSSCVVVVVDGVAEASAFLRRAEAHANRFGCMIRSEYVQCKWMSIVGKLASVAANVEQQAMSIARTMMVLAAASGKLTEITVDCAVALALADVHIPPQVRRIGIADQCATGALVSKLPAVLHNVTRHALQRNVTLWMTRMPLRVHAPKRRALLLRAIRACRRATHAALRAHTLRGALEDMLAHDVLADVFV